MSILFNDNIKVAAPKLLDSRTKKEDGTDYATKAEVLTALSPSRRATGLLVMVAGILHYFKGGTTLEAHIVPLEGGGGGSGGGIEEAPLDSKLYGRKNGAWVEITGGGDTSVPTIQSLKIDMLK